MFYRWLVDALKNDRCKQSSFGTDWEFRVEQIFETKCGKAVPFSFSYTWLHLKSLVRCSSVQHSQHSQHTSSIVWWKTHARKKENVKRTLVRVALLPYKPARGLYSFAVSAHARDLCRNVEYVLFVLASFSFLMQEQMRFANCCTCSTVFAVQRTLVCF